MILCTTCKATGRPTSELEYLTGPFSHFMATENFCAGFSEGGAVRLDIQPAEGLITDDDVPVQWRAASGWDNPAAGAGLNRVDYVTAECDGYMTGLELAVSFDGGAIEYALCLNRARVSSGGFTVNARSHCRGINVSLEISGTYAFYIKRILGVTQELSLGYQNCMRR